MANVGAGPGTRRRLSLAIAGTLLVSLLPGTSWAAGRIEQEPTTAELAQARARVGQLKATEQHQAANLDDAQGALRASAELAGQALETYSIAVRTLQTRQAREQQTQDTLGQAQQTVVASRQALGRWARQAYQGGTGLAADATLNTLFQASSTDDIDTDLVVLRRIGQARGQALHAVQHAERDAGADANAAANASQDAATAAISAATAKNSADQAVEVQRQLLGIAESTLTEARSNTTAAVQTQNALQAAAARAQAQATARQAAAAADAGANDGATRDNRVTGQVGSCTGGAVEQYANGEIPLSVLCPLWSTTGQYLRADAAFAFDQLSHEYADQFGTPICITDSYRSYPAQVSLFARKPGLAAIPGTSNHGWGTAVDLCGGIESFDTVPHNWMLVNAPLYGWFHPSWAEPTGSRPEPWHWEFGG